MISAPYRGSLFFLPPLSINFFCSDNVYSWLSSQTIFFHRLSGGYKFFGFFFFSFSCEFDRERSLGREHHTKSPFSGADVLSCIHKHSLPARRSSWGGSWQSHHQSARHYCLVINHFWHKWVHAVPTALLILNWFVGLFFSFFFLC